MVNVKETEIKNGKRLEVVFKSGKKVTIDITDEMYGWIQVFTDDLIIPNVKTLGREAKRRYGEHTKSVAICLWLHTVDLI